ncbi:hypothetical protein TraAM80_08371 [Trypanosoma rangeli]|uniref:Uncharacterized protein n=1 Tax=Trypanosoma rangeli TaxID=5698 RepID=A0A422N0Z0_TRYRA|nr:uncharacterized protein TraAM80_08371 [Trypanosoma rangeli]RNE99123.1 hypothetical protein TraAM80_08371 [Trypanosoma rangeli]|eukprot:RNE99123.1 hypothetical protein TraAM80_08371 [Trypanosoma rangeli]
MYQPIVREELDVYLPNFDPVRDPQVGEWVLVSPHRRAALVNPLVQMAAQRSLQPIYPFLVGNVPADAPSSASVLAAAEPTSRPHVDPRHIFPTLDEVCRKYRRHRMQTGKVVTNEKIETNNKNDGDEEEDETTLYLNPRALLLTPCAPAVFGGSDFIEGLDKTTGRVVFLNWKTGEVRTDSLALQPRPTPEWAEEVVEKAMVEWEDWKRREKKAVQSQELGCEAPPFQKARTE